MRTHHSSTFFSPFSPSVDHSLQWTHLLRLRVCVCVCFFMSSHRQFIFQRSENRHTNWIPGISRTRIKTQEGRRGRRERTVHNKLLKNSIMVNINSAFLVCLVHISVRTQTRWNIRWILFASPSILCGGVARSPYIFSILLFLDSASIVFHPSIFAWAKRKWWF